MCSVELSKRPVVSVRTGRARTEIQGSVDLIVTVSNFKIS